MQRIAIAGVPRAGKTSYALRLAQQTSMPVIHGDDFISLGWSEASLEVARRLLEPGPYIIEGVSVIRGLRKALELSPERPCDRLHWFDLPRQQLSPGQSRMADADRQRLRELRAALEQRGVQVVDGAAIGAAPSSTATVVSPSAASPAMPTPPPAPLPSPVPAAARVALEVPCEDSRWSRAPGRGFG